MNIMTADERLKHTGVHRRNGRMDEVRSCKARSLKFFENRRVFWYTLSVPLDHLAWVREFRLTWRYKYEEQEGNALERDRYRRKTVFFQQHILC